MGKVKAMAMDMEEMFFEGAQDAIIECDSFIEFLNVMEPQLDLVAHMDRSEVDCILAEMWNDILLEYI